MKFSQSALVLSSVLFAAAAPSGGHRDEHAKRDVVVVTEYVNEGGAVVVPPAEQQTQTTADYNTATATLHADRDTTTLSPKATATKGSSGVSNSQSNSGSFQDGTIACSDFPSGNGVVSLDWLGMGGWASIQDSNGQSVTSCSEGNYCSYACDSGMAKTQWPSSQPASGASLGGLICKDGFLHRTNTDADSLCQSGENVASVVNKGSSGSVALCMTDYPGSENMVIPTVVGEGSTEPLTVVNSDSFYTWQGKKTSAQYYVNNAGVSKEDGCVWGSAGSGVGNWAPLVIGAGSSNGQTYLSLIPNPNNGDSANFNVKIEGTSGSNVQGDCKYENGSFSGGDGCTVSIISGSAQVVFY
ncbi:SUN family protein NCA3 KNAG_0B01580 [Huiozyma naganishii CBS 8797]|uniref:Uncharacterized protein n=1 Tax=Huiozyma naganishii (strain ATCC MYA-139 / BCRC 22969 / CBS 8797 / KCTC 17520 / NBRC 10181 / NCYC 3082 / Yp74L-3) TaxID=1071383 RepID=J7R1C6_HUIN7|nr:hypothetical protein KNAG_0B01580 [Kazachstania naganishii CBS 8797]CCK68605.1 hypothetical protein KNAG_0B01580 [Kazachstania naganishii CBS 8797]